MAAPSGLSRRLLLAAALLCSIAAPAVAQRSNIVFILVDDMDYGLLAHMPKLRTLVTERGMEFRNHFVSVSLCCPSRATTLRGQYAHNTGVFTNRWPDGGFDRFYRDGLESSTVATWLRQSGYRTALIGKYLNGYPNDESGTQYVPPGWSYWFSPNGGRAYTQYNYSINFNGRTLTFGSEPADHMNDVLLRRANSFLRNAAADTSGRPFFLFLAPYLPHSPATPPVRYEDLFPGVKAPRPPSFNEADISDKPRWLQDSPLLTEAQIAEIDALYRKRRQSTKSLDDMVESLVNTLRATGKLSSTYVFFASDNGFHMGQHRRPPGKTRVFEEDIRVPLVVRGPGIPAGRVVHQLTANVDYAPTFAAIAGVARPSFVDGRSLVPLFAGPPPVRWRQVLLLESPTSIEGLGSTSLGTDAGLLEPTDSTAEPQSHTTDVTSLIYRGLRTAGNRTFALYENGDGELYNMHLDPYQLVNRYSSLSPSARSSLTNHLQALRAAAGQALRNAEEVPAGTWP